MPDETLDDRKSTATCAGYHFLNMYQCCPWKWYIRFYRYLVPQKVAKFLTYGQAFHFAKEMFYKKHLESGELLSRSDMIEVGILYLEEHAECYAKKDEYEEDLVKIVTMVGDWYDKWAASEFNDYTILAVEEEMRVDLPGGFIATVRPDVLVQINENGLFKMFETKSTSYSVPAMAASVAKQKQVDMQMLGARKWLKEHGANPDDLAGVQPDIGYVKQSKHEAARPAIIGRSEKELADSQLAFTGIFSEIGQKLATLDKGVLPPEMLFPRNGTWCSQVGCEYEAICNSRWTHAPVGFSFENDEEAGQ